jgi:hypothetical protein
MQLAGVSELRFFAIVLLLLLLLLLLLVVVVVVVIAPNSFRLIKSRRMSWVGCVARVGERRGAPEFSSGYLREGDRLKDPGVN